MNLKDKRNNYINADRAISAYLKDANRYKVLTEAEEEELVDKMLAGDEEAKNKLIAHNLRFAYSVAKAYGNENNVLDLAQEANKALMIAANKFDKSMGNRFLSYAIWFIRREIAAYLNSIQPLIQKTNNTKTVYKLSKIKSKFFAEHNRYPDVDEMAQILEEEYNFKVKDRSDLLDITTTSINTCYDDEDSRAFENSPYFTDRTSVDNEYQTEIDREYNASVSGSLMSVLSEREQTIVKMAFGIGYNKEYTNAEIGEDIGMSSERVRQIKNEAIQKMKDFATVKHLSF